MAWPPVTHQDVQDDLTNGHGWASSLSGRLGIAERLFAAPTLWEAGRWYGPTTAGDAISTLVPSANVLYLTPFYSPIARAIDTIGINVTAAGGAGTLLRVGIYNADATTGFPTTVLVDSGSLAADSTGDKSVAASQTLAGLYWFGCTTQAGTVRAWAAGAGAAIGGASGLTGTVSNMLIKTSTNASSALPNLTGVSPSYLTGAAVPAVQVRAA